MHMVIVQIMALLVAITIHEMAHGWAAYRLGDPTPKLHGRLTFNPLAHIDFFGTVLFPGILILLNSPVLFGWAKPIPINPSSFRRPRRDTALVSLAGPASNLVLGLVCGVLLRLKLLWPASAGALTLGAASGEVAAPLYWFLLSCLSINIILAVFNMIPVPPLDGGHFLEGVLPYNLSRAYRRIEPFGMVIIFLLIYLGFLDRVIAPVHGLIISMVLR